MEEAAETERYPDDWNRDKLDKNDEGNFRNGRCAELATAWTKNCYNDNEYRKIEEKYFNYTPVEGTCENYSLASQRNTCNLANCSFAFCISQRDEYIELCQKNTNAWLALVEH